MRCGYSEACSGLPTWNTRSPRNEHVVEDDGAFELVTGRSDRVVIDVVTHRRLTGNHRDARIVGRTGAVEDLFALDSRAVEDADVNVVGERRSGAHGFDTVDHDAVVARLHDTQRGLGRVLPGPVDLRVDEGEGAVEVALLHQIQELPDAHGQVTPARSHGLVAPGLRVLFVGDQTVVVRARGPAGRSAVELPDHGLQVHTLAPQPLGVPVLEPHHRTTHPVVIDEGHDVLQLGLVVQVVELRHTLGLRPGQRVGRDVVDPFTSDPDNAPVPERLQVLLASSHQVPPLHFTQVPSCTHFSSPDRRSIPHR